MTNEPAVEERPLPISPPEKRGNRKIFAALISIFGICMLLQIAWFIYAQINPRSPKVSILAKEGREFTPSIKRAISLINQNKCIEAIVLLDKIIDENPKLVDAYELHSYCIAGIQSNVFSERQGYLLAALKDTNILIELEPEVGNWYVRRELTLRELANLEIESATSFAIYEIATENAKKAIELGVDPQYGYVHRHYARNLIESNQCEEGLKETQALIDKTAPQDEAIGAYYNVYLTEAYICLDELDKALEIAQYITCDDPVSTCKSGLLTEIYFQAGDYENALNTVNYMINWQPAGGGWRYFIRALIYYEQGKVDLAMQDLELGDTYSWDNTGVYWYVQARLAFDAGDKENGIAYLQQAEQTLDIGYAPLRQKIIEELKSYGEEPIELSPNLPFTPIPITN